MKLDKKKTIIIAVALAAVAGGGAIIYGGISAIRADNEASDVRGGRPDDTASEHMGRRGPGMMADGEMPEMPDDMELPDSMELPDGMTPPEMSEDGMPPELPDGETPPEMPNGEKPTRKAGNSSAAVD